MPPPSKLPRPGNAVPPSLRVIRAGRAGEHSHEIAQDYVEIIIAELIAATGKRVIDLARRLESLTSRSRAPSSACNATGSSRAGPTALFF